MIEPDHLEAAGNPIIPRGAKFEGERFERFTEYASAAKKHGSLAIAQVSHPGRQVTNTIQKNPISASDVHLTSSILGMNFNKPRAATEEDIKNIIDGFAHAAEYLEKSGWDGIQLHAAHGYLLAQFLSPTTNLRTDKYGGSLENRSRIIIEIAAEVRRRTSKNFIVGIKLNSVEFQDKGFNPEDAKALCKILEQNNFDFVELSGGTYEKLAWAHQKESSRKREAFFMEFADMITPSLTKTKVYVTGGFRTVGAMVEALDSTNGIGIGRPLCQEPRLCKDILAGKVTGVIKCLVADNDYGASVSLAGALIKQIGKDLEPTDMSVPENVQAFATDMGAFMEKMAADSTNSQYGYVDLSSTAVPYGAPVLN